LPTALKDNILTDVLSGKVTVHTKFIASKNTSGKKKWIAHSQNFAKGVVVVNEGAKTVLTSSKATSLLPVGVKY
jgi:glutamate 5-kinase